MGDVVVTGYHRTELDYDTAVYYDPRVCGSLYRDGVEMQRRCYHGIGSATTTTTTPYVEGSEYEAVTDHLAEMQYYQEDPTSYFNQYGYFGNAGDHIPDFFFYPSGIFSTSPVNALSLGSTHAKIGPPHHLMVISDNTTTLPCGQIERKWRLKVVDFHDHSVGRVHIRENFPGQIVDSCDSRTIPPTACDNGWYNATFKGYEDAVKAGGCAPPPVCGFEIRYNEWKWCKPGIAEVGLATMLYEVYTDQIKLDGSLKFLADRRIF
jgi:hypothetical protein